jgi:trans-2,3-dihydro-3-hydroxyanthranilate isomerase
MKKLTTWKSIRRSKSNEFSIRTVNDGVLMSRQFYITDVFHSGGYSGNQLATVVDTAGLTSDDMQVIAREFNFSETTFLVGGDFESGYDVRIFTPSQELPFAGHPTLGSAYLIREYVAKLTSDRLVLNLAAGKITVTFANDGVVWMRQKQPEFGEFLDKQTAADALGLALDDIDEDYPVQSVSTGLGFTLVPVKSLQALKRINQQGSLGFGIFAFTREGYTAEYDISSRMLANDAGISEDPATGSANGCLASYLVHHQYFGGASIDIRVAQGFEINRPSTLYLRASHCGAEYEINVGGEVKLSAEGRLV